MALCASLGLSGCDTTSESPDVGMSEQAAGTLAPAAEVACAPGPSQFQIGNATFTNLYSQYYDAAIARYCRERGWNQPKCDEFKQLQDSVRTAPYYNPSAGILVTQAEAELASQNYLLSWLVSGVTISLFYGPDYDSETRSLLGGLCPSNNVSFIPQSSWTSFSAAHPAEAALLESRSDGGHFVAVYCKACAGNLSHFAIGQVLSGLQAQYNKMLEMINNPQPNAPVVPECRDDADCRARIGTGIWLIEQATNPHCEYSTPREEFVCKLYAKAGQACPGAGSSGQFEWPCDTGLTCVQIKAETWFSFAKYECRAAMPAAYVPPDPPLEPAVAMTCAAGSYLNAMGACMPIEVVPAYVPPPTPSSVCTPGSFMNADGVCMPYCAAYSCDDGNPNTTDTCDWLTGTCMNTPVAPAFIPAEPAFDPAAPPLAGADAELPPENCPTEPPPPPATNNYHLVSLGEATVALAFDAIDPGVPIWNRIDATYTVRFDARDPEVTSTTLLTTFYYACTAGNVWVLDRATELGGSQRTDIGSIRSYDVRLKKQFTTVPEEVAGDITGTELLSFADGAQSDSKNILIRFGGGYEGHPGPDKPTLVDISTFSSDTSQVQLTRTMSEILRIATTYYRTATGWEQSEKLTDQSKTDQVSDGIKQEKRVHRAFDNLVERGVFKSQQNTREIRTVTLADALVQHFMAVQFFQEDLFGSLNRQLTLDLTPTTFLGELRTREAAPALPGAPPALPPPASSISLNMSFVAPQWQIDMIDNQPVAQPATATQIDTANLYVRLLRDVLGQHGGSTEFSFPTPPPPLAAP